VTLNILIRGPPSAHESGGLILCVGPEVLVYILVFLGGVTPGGATPRASLRFCLSQVGHTSGFTAAARFPRWGHHSEARGVPHPPRARATVYSTPQLIKIFFSRFSLVLKASQNHRIVEKCFNKITHLQKFPSLSLLCHPLPVTPLCHPLPVTHLTQAHPHSHLARETCHHYS
jgi:hypothetical protein